LTPSVEEDDDDAVDEAEDDDFNRTPSNDFSMQWSRKRNVKAYCMGVWTMPARWSRSSSTVWNTGTDVGLLVLAR